VHRKTLANSKICKIRAKDIEKAGKMSGEIKINLQNEEEILILQDYSGSIRHKQDA